MSKQVEEMPLRYKRSHEGQFLYANGAYGGLGPKGEIAVHFYVDVFGLPEASKLQKIDNGSAREIDVQGEPYVSREVVASFILMPPTAEAIGRWLLSKAALAKAQALGSQESPKPDEQTRI